MVFFNYGVDTGTVWKSAPAHEPILWRHVSWGRLSPDREVKELSRWGWLFYRRVKTGKAFYRPMNRAVRDEWISAGVWRPHFFSRGGRAGSRGGAAGAASNWIKVFASL